MSPRDKAAREDEKEQAERRRELAQLQAEADLRAVASSPAGRRFLWRLIEQRCGLLNGIQTESQAQMSHAEGKRAVGRELLAELQRVAPPQATQMVREWTQALEERQLRVEVSQRK